MKTSNEAYTTVNVIIDELETIADQRHQGLTQGHRKKSLTWVGIVPTTSGLDHLCSTDRDTRPDGSRPWEF